MATSSFTSGPYYIDALLSGRSWTGTTGQEATLHYNYNTRTTSHDGNVRNAKLLTATQEAATEKAIQSWENVANINFIEDATASGNSKNLIIRQSDLGSGVSGTTYTSYSGTKFALADVRLNSQSSSDYAVGSQGYKTIIHELGHAIGIKHPGDYSGGGSGTSGPFLPRSEDSWNATVMSYNQGSLATYNNSPTTPMIYDIAAAQHLYGANTSYNSGNTTYTINGAKNAMTIWDGGGNDTLNASNYTGSSVIDLREGLNNVSKVGSSATWIAFNAKIENATTGSGSDTLYGNQLSNKLIGNAGNDKIYGNGGNDTLLGGSGNDRIEAGTGNDSVDGGSGADTIMSGSGNDTIIGGAGNDIIYGNSGNDVFVFMSGSGNDVIKDFAAPGSAIGDLIRIDDAVFSSTSQILSAIDYTSSGGVISFSSGGSVTIAGVSSNALTAADFQII